MFGITTATRTPLFGLPLGALDSSELIPMGFIAGGALGGAVGAFAAMRGGNGAFQGALWGAGAALFSFLLIKTLSV